MNPLFAKAIKSFFMTFLGYLFSYFVYALANFSISFSGITVNPNLINNPLTNTLISSRGGVVTQENDFLIKSDLTINIPADHLTIDAAFDWLRGYRIQSDVTVTIQVSDGVYNAATDINISHLDGRKVNILGNTTTPSSVTLNCATRCFALSNTSIGLIDGMTLVGVVNTGSAITARLSSYVNLGASMSYQNFKQTIVAHLNSFVEVRGGTVRNAGYNGLRSSLSSYLSIENVDVRNSDHGIFIYKSSFATIRNSISRDNTSGSLNVGLRSTAEITGSTVTNPTQSFNSESYILNY